MVSLLLDGYTQWTNFSTVGRADNVSREFVTPTAGYDATQIRKTGGRDARLPNSSQDPAAIADDRTKAEQDQNTLLLSTVHLRPFNADLRTAQLAGVDLAGIW